LLSRIRRFTIIAPRFRYRSSLVSIRLARSSNRYDGKLLTYRPCGKKGILELAQKIDH
jgi:hypothetical protein